MALLSCRFNDLSYPDQIVDGAGEGEHPPPTLETLVSGLPHQPNGLCPSKNLLYRFAFPLADPRGVPEKHGRPGDLRRGASRPACDQAVPGDGHTGPAGAEEAKTRDGPPDP